LIRPGEVAIHEIGCLTDTLGKTEIECAAAVLVRYHVARGLVEWTPVTLRELGEYLMTDDVVRRWATNPFWRPDPYGLAAGGWVKGWETPDAPGEVTSDFLFAVANPGSWRGRNRGLVR